MDSDGSLVLVVLLIYIATLYGLVIVSGKAAVRTLILNLLILITYATYFFLQYYYWGEPGSALVWWFYSLLFLLLHWFCNGILLIVRLIRKRTQKENFLIDQ